MGKTSKEAIDVFFKKKNKSVWKLYNDLFLSWAFCFKDSSTNPESDEVHSVEIPQKISLHC
jgi:hypothetical protein